VFSAAAAAAAAAYSTLLLHHRLPAGASPVKLPALYPLLPRTSPPAVCVLLLLLSLLNSCCTPGILREQPLAGSFLCKLPQLLPPTAAVFSAAAVFSTR
jgi:hypothetical protein